MTRVEFFAEGVPQTKGSARGFNRGGRVVITNDNPKAKAWARVVSVAAREAHAGEALAHPVAVELVFYLPRPKAHAGARGLKAWAPRVVATKPDVDKLARCALDALTGVVLVDDSQVVRLVATKVYGSPGVSVVVMEVEQ